MKELKELLEMSKKAINTNCKKEGNFLSYDAETGEIYLHNDYNSAKLYAEKGGQVLVIDKEKVYTYKIKNEEEYQRYLRNQIYKENMEKMNRYGL